MKRVKTNVLQWRLAPALIFIAVLGLGLGADICPLRADTTTSPAPAAAATPPAPPAKKETAEFHSTTQGITNGFEADSGQFGLGLTLETGPQYTGIKSYDGKKYLFQWNTEAVAKGGIIANSLTPMPLLGGRADASAEFGYRILPATSWSPYVSAGGDFKLLALSVLVIPVSSYNTVSNLDGLAGINLSGTGRISLGASYLDANHSLLFTAFVQEGLRAPGINAPGIAFTEVGIHGQYDVTQSLTVMLEALYGKDDTGKNYKLSSTSQTSHLEGAAMFRKTFKSGLWLGVGVKVSEDTTKTTYSASGNTYDTAPPISAAATINVGVPIR